MEKSIDQYCRLHYESTLVELATLQASYRCAGDANLSKENSYSNAAQPQQGFIQSELLGCMEGGRNAA